MPLARLDPLADAVPQDPARARGPLVDAAALAAELGTSRDFIYEHAAELGALRLGRGPRARLRFDPAVARAALAGTVCCVGERSQAHTASSDGTSRAAMVPRRRRLPDGSPEPGAILPIRPRPRRRKAGA
jgi:hypothetical protein